MKKLLILPLFILLIMAGCKDKENAPTRVQLNVYKQEKSSTGTITSSPANAIIHFWKAENKEFDVAASGPDIAFGSAYDAISKTKYSAEYGAIGVAFNEELDPGKYFALVLLNNKAYTYTTFNVEPGKRLYLKKTFSHNIADGQYEDWDKNK